MFLTCGCCYKYAYISSILEVKWIPCFIRRVWLIVFKGWSSAFRFIYLYFYWVCWGNIGSHSHTGSVGTTQQNINCTLHRVLTTQSRGACCPHFPPLSGVSFHPHCPSLLLSTRPLPLFPSGYLHTAVCVCVILCVCVYLCFVLNSLTFPPPAVNLFHISMPLF